jgi:uncharacterized protein YbjT (DUF2867 family)
VNLPFVVDDAVDASESCALRSGGRDARIAAPPLPDRVLLDELVDARGADEPVDQPPRRVAGNTAALGEGFDVGGPEVMTYRQMLERMARLLGRTPIIVEVPVLTPYLSSLWLDLVTPVNASVARPLVEGLRNPTIAREERIRELVTLELTAFDDAARRALS